MEAAFVGVIMLALMIPVYGMGVYRGYQKGLVHGAKGNISRRKKVVYVHDR